MTTTMTFPAAYNVLSQEEMIYTGGGVSNVQVACAWFLPFYGWYKGVSAIRNYRSQHPDDWIVPGLGALADDMESSPEKLYYDLGCTAHVLASSATGIGLILNLVIILN